MHDTSSNTTLKHLMMCRQKYHVNEIIFENELLEEEGMLIMEHSKHTKLDHMMNFSFAKNRVVISSGNKTDSSRN